MTFYPVPILPCSTISRRVTYFLLAAHAAVGQKWSSRSAAAPGVLVSILGKHLSRVLLIPYCLVLHLPAMSRRVHADSNRACLFGAGRFSLSFRIMS